MDEMMPMTWALDTHLALPALVEGIAKLISPQNTYMIFELPPAAAWAAVVDHHKADWLKALRP